MSFTHRADAEAIQDPAGTSLTINKPVGLQVGDLMVAVIGKDDDPEITTVPAGWQTAVTFGSALGNDIRSGIYWIVATSVQTAATDFTWEGDPEMWSGTISAFASTNGGNLVSVSVPVRRDGDASPISLAIAAATAGNLLIGACVSAQADVGGLGSATAGYTLGGNPTTGTSNGDNGSILAYDLSAAGGETTYEANNAESAAESHPYILEFEDEAPVLPGFNQRDFRIRKVDPAAGLNATFDASDPAVNTAAEIDADQPFRIRFAAEQIGAVEVAHKIQYKKGAGSWTDVPVETGLTPSTVSEVAALDAATFIGSAYTNGDATTQLLSADSPFVAGDGVEGANVTGTVGADDSFLENEYLLVIRRWFDAYGETADGTEFQFRLVEADSTEYLGYDQTPTITLNIPVGYIGGTMIETPNRIGPFADDNGALYLLLENTTNSNSLLLVKSTDGGDTWTEATGTGRPTQADLECVDVVVEGGDVLHIVMTDGLDVEYHKYNMSSAAVNPDTWQTIDDSVSSGGSGNIGLQACSIVQRPGESDFVVFYNKWESGSGLDYGYYKIGTSGSWGTEQTLEASDIHAITAVLGADGSGNDKVHVFYADEAGTPAIRHRSLNNADTLSGSDDVTTDVSLTTPEENPFTQAVYWESGADRKAMIVFRGDTDGYPYSSVVTNDGAPSTPALVSATQVMYDAPDQSGNNSRQVVANLVVDGTDVYLHYADLATGDLWRDTSADGGAWGTDTEELDDKSIEWVRGTVFTHSSGNGGAKVVGYLYDNGSGGGQGQVWYDEYALATVVYHDGAVALAGAGALTATGGLVVLGAASPTGAGALSATGDVVRTGVAAFAGSGDLSATGIVTASGVAAFAGVGDLTATATVTVSGSADLDGTGILTATGTLLAFLEQTGFRFRNDDDGETAATWKAALNGDVDLSDAGTVFRIRLLIGNTGGDATGAQNWYLYRSLNSGAWTLVSAISAVAQVADSPHVVTSIATTQQLGSGTFDAGRWVEGAFSPALDIPAGEETEIEWTIALVPADITTADTIDFRAELSGGVDLNAYTEVGRATIAAAVIEGAVAFGGTGDLTVAGQAVLDGATSVTGSGSLEATGSTVVAGLASLTGAGSLQASGGVVTPGAATFTGAGTLTPTGAVLASGVVAFTGSGALAATGVLDPVEGSATFDGTGVLTATAEGGVAGAVAFAGAGSLAAAGGSVADGTATLAGAGDLTTAGVVAVSGVAAFTGTGTLTGSSGVVVDGASTLAGSGTVTAAGVVVVSAAATFTGSGILTADAASELEGSVAFTGTGTVTAAGLIVVGGSATLDGVGSLTATAIGMIDGAATFDGTGNLAGTGHVVVSGATSATGTGDVTATGNAVHDAASSFAGAGTLDATAGPIVHDGTATATGTGDLAAAGQRVYAGAATLTGTGILTGDIGSFYWKPTPTGYDVEARVWTPALPGYSTLVRETP